MSPHEDEDRADVAGPAHDDGMTLAEFTAQARALGADVDEVPGREPNGPCPYCQTIGWPAEITVQTSHWKPVDPWVNEMCRECALREIARDIESGYDVLAEIPAPVPTREQAPADDTTSKEHTPHG